MVVSLHDGVRILLEIDGKRSQPFRTLVRRQRRHRRRRRTAALYQSPPASNTTNIKFCKLNLCYSSSLMSDRDRRARPSLSLSLSRGAGANL